MKTNLLTLFLIISSVNVFAQNAFQRGCNFDSTEYKTVRAASRLTERSYENLPASFSLKKYTAIPGSQGMQGSCSGWASTYAAQTILESIALERTDQNISKSEAFSPSFIYNRTKGDPLSCSQGSAIMDALTLMKNEGCLKLMDFQYINNDCSRQPQNADISKAGAYKIKEYIRLTGMSIEKEEVIKNIKKALYNKNPVVMGFTCYNSFDTAKDVYNIVVDQKSPGGHAICIIGYDDNKYGGAFEVMNSWGTRWGNEGFTHIRYADLIGDPYFHAYQVIGLPANSPVPVEEKFLGSVKLVKSDGSEFKASLNNDAKRGFEIISAEKPTYKLNEPALSGDKFRILFNTNKTAYAYLISYGTKSNIAKTIFPFSNFTALLNANSEVAIPNEDYYIQLDKNIGTDYLTVIYSTESIDIDEICKQINAKAGTFMARLKDSLKDKMISGNNISFKKEHVSFIATNDAKNILPVIIEFQHQ